MSTIDEGECILCGGTGELRATTLRDERDTVGCPACIESEAARALSAEKAAREEAERAIAGHRYRENEAHETANKSRMEWDAMLSKERREANRLVESLRASIATAETETARLRERVKAAVAEEREACAKLCDAVEFQQDCDNGAANTGGAAACAAAIRSRESSNE